MEPFGNCYHRKDLKDIKLCVHDSERDTPPHAYVNTRYIRRRTTTSLDEPYIYDLESSFVLRSRRSPVLWWSGGSW